MSISTHVLDTARGRPAEGVPITLEKRTNDGSWSPVGSGTTNSDGRVQAIVDAGKDLAEGTYKMTFDTDAYFRKQGVEGFYPYAAIVFQIRAADEHYHVPLLLSPFGYSTYRGS